MLRDFARDLESFGIPHGKTPRVQLGSAPNVSLGMIDRTCPLQLAVCGQECRQNSVPCCSSIDQLYGAWAVKAVSEKMFVVSVTQVLQR